MAKREGDDDGQDEVASPPSRSDCRADRHDDADEGAGGEQLAVGEVDQFDDPVDDGVAQAR
jgi:hypothetical protein